MKILEELFHRIPSTVVLATVIGVFFSELFGKSIKLEEKNTEILFTNAILLFGLYVFSYALVYSAYIVFVPERTVETGSKKEETRILIFTERTIEVIAITIAGCIAFQLQTIAHLFGVIGLLVLIILYLTQPIWGNIEKWAINRKMRAQNTNAQNKKNE